MAGKFQIGPFRGVFHFGDQNAWCSSENESVNFPACLPLVMRRPPVLPPALVDTQTLSQGCSSALLFRDNDKDLNPSVDSTFVPSSIFKLS